MLPARLIRYSTAAAALLFGMAECALAHPGHGAHGFSDGWQHPLLGLDHLLGAVAVGLLAARFAGKKAWLAPSVFLGGMLAGVAVASAGVALPGAVAGVAASVVVLGVLVAAATVELRTGLALVGLSAVFHGYAHAAPLAASGAVAAYVTGLALATAALHAAGLLAGRLLLTSADRTPLRAAGGLVAAAGVVLAVGLL